MAHPSLVTTFARRMVMFAGIWLAGVAPAHAYLDPGTGSLMLQMLVGGLSAGVAIVAGFWSRVRLAFLVFVGRAARSHGARGDVDRSVDDDGA